MNNKQSILLAVIAVALLPFLVSIKVKAGLPSEVIGYKESDDEQVWTIEKALPNEYDKFISNPSCWYPEGEEVETDHGSVLDSMKEWEHAYSYRRTIGIVPIKKWRVQHRAARCIHSDAGEVITGFHDIMDSPYVCKTNYYSGWIPYCADCGDELVAAYHYFSRDTVKSITELDIAKGYFYNCPNCGNLEQGHDASPHECKGVSTNRYAVIYENNADDANGKMTESYHMWNNDYFFEGEMIVPQKKLSLCTFERTGYVFNGWNTKPDGSGVSFGNGAEIYNLTYELYGNVAKNYDDKIIENNIENQSYITLYAQWKKIKTTLLIEAGNGYYDGTYGTKEIVQEYNTFYTLNESLFSPGNGYKVSFESNGGTKVSAIQKKEIYKGYTTGGNYNGRMAGQMKGNIYRFLGPLGTVDKIVALWEQQPISLPETSKEGYTFGGWYIDQACTRPIGTAGDSFTPTSDCTLYAKWVTLHLTSTNNYTDHGGKGAVDLEWGMPNSEGNAYVIYQSRDGIIYERVYDAKDSVNPTETSIDGTYAYTGSAKTVIVPYSGFYEVKVNGAQGNSFTKDGKNYTGGKGTSITAKYYFQKGEKLTLRAGGKTGWNGGGVSFQNGAYGGGYSEIVSDIQGVLLRAAGGGGGGLAGNGGDADAGTNFVTSPMGQSSSAGGGGGGANGGLGGIYEIHTHTESCYKLVHEHTGQPNQSSSNGCYTKAVTETGSCYISKMAVNHSSWGCPKCGGTVNHTHYKGYHSVCGSELNYHQNRCGSCGYDSSSGGNWSAGSHTYTRTTYAMNCGYSDKEDKFYELECKLSNRIVASTGGKSEVFGTPISYSFKYGECEGDGSISIQAVDTGYMEETSLKGIKAYDVTPPKQVEGLRINYEKSSAERLRITFEPAVDYGTTYYHKVEAYILSTGAYLNTSNITSNNLATGVKGYWYLLDTNFQTVINESNRNVSLWLDEAMNQEQQLEVLLKEQVQYLHVAVQDLAGNIGPTVTLKIPGTVEDSEELAPFSIEARVVRILSPHEPKFKRGESGEVHIFMRGYGERLEVLFPAEMTVEGLQRFQVFTYSGEDYKQEESIPFQIPLYMEEGAYEIKVWAYKGEEVLEANPEFLTISINGSVLDEIRTRLR